MFEEIQEFPIPQNDPELENRLMYQLVIENQRRQSARQSLRQNPALVDRMKDIAKVFPTMRPGLVQGLALANAPDDVVADAWRANQDLDMQEGRYHRPNATRPGLTSGRPRNSLNEARKQTPDGTPLHRNRERLDTARRLAQNREREPQAGPGMGGFSPTSPTGDQTPSGEAGPGMGRFSPTSPEDARSVGDPAAYGLGVERAETGEIARAGFGPGSMHLQGLVTPTARTLDHTMSGAASLLKGTTRALTGGFDHLYQELYHAAIPSAKIAWQDPDISFAEAMEEAPRSTLMNAMIEENIDNIRDQAPPDASYQDLFEISKQDLMHESGQLQHMGALGSVLGSEVAQPVGDHFRLMGGQITREEIAEREADTPLGAGFFGTRDIEQHAYRQNRLQAMQFAAQHRPEMLQNYEDPLDIHLTTGRLIAEEFFEPGEREYELMSGAFDFLATIFDPTAVLTAGVSRKATAARQFGAARTGAEPFFPRTTRLARAARDRTTRLGETMDAAVLGQRTREGLLRPDNPREAFLSGLGFHRTRSGIVRGPVADAENFIDNTSQGRALINTLTETTSADRIRRSFDKRIHPALAQRFAELDDPHLVRQAFLDGVQGKIRNHNGRRLVLNRDTGELEQVGEYRHIIPLREKPGGQGLAGNISRFLAQGRYGDEGAALGIVGVKRANPNYRRFTSRTPYNLTRMDDDIHLAEQTERILRNANLPAATAENHMNRMIRAISDGSFADKRRVLIDAHKDIVGQITLQSLGFGQTSQHIRYADDGRIIPLTAQGREARAYAKEVGELTQNMFYRFESAQRQYFIDGATGQPMRFPGSKVSQRGDYEIADATAGLLSEMMERTFPTLDPREIRRMTGVMAPLWRRRPGQKGLDFKRGSMDTLEKIFINTWQPLQLFRVAWPVRVGIEELGGRIPMAGLDGLNHPAAYLFAALGGKKRGNMFTSYADAPFAPGTAGAGADHLLGQVADRFGTYRTTLELEDFHGLNEFQQAMNPTRRSGGWITGEGPSTRQLREQARNANAHRHHNRSNLTNDSLNQLESGAWSPPIPVTDKRASVAISRELNHLHSDPIMRRLARGLTDDEFRSIPHHRRVAVHDRNSTDAIKEWFWGGSGREYRERLAHSIADGEYMPPVDQAYYGFQTRSEALLNSRQYADDYLIRHHKARLDQATMGDADLRQLIGEGELGNIRLEPRMMATDNPQTRDLVKFIHRKKLEAINDNRAPRWVKGTEDVADPGAYTGRMEEAMDAVGEWIFSRPNDLTSRGPVYRQYYWREVERIFPEMPRAERQKVLNRIGPDPDGANLPASMRTRLREKHRAAPDNPDGPTIEAVNANAKNTAVEDTKRLLYDLTDRGQIPDMARIFSPFLEAMMEMTRIWGHRLFTNPQYMHRARQAHDAGRSSGMIYEDPLTGEDRFVYQGGEILANLGIAGTGASLPDNAQVQLSGRLQGVNLLAQSATIPLGPAATWPLAIVTDFDDYESRFIDEVFFPYGRPEGPIAEQTANQFFPAWVDTLRSAIDGDTELNYRYNSLVGEAMRALSATGEYTNDQMGRATNEEIDRLAEDSHRVASGLMWMRGVTQFALPTGPDIDLQVVDEQDAIAYTIGELAQEFDGMIDDNDGDFSAATDDFIDRFGYNFTAALQSKSNQRGRPITTLEGWQWESNNQELRTRLPNTLGYFAPNPEGEFDLRAFLREDREHLSPEEMAHARNNTLGWMRYEREMDRFEEILTDYNLDEDQKQRARDEHSTRVRRAIKNEGYRGFNEDIPGLDTSTNLDQLIFEVHQAVEEPGIMETDAGKATAEYLRLRNVAVEEMGRLDLADRPTEPFTQSQSPEAEAARDYLMRAGIDLIGRYPDFRGIFEDVFLRDLGRTDVDLPSNVAIFEATGHSPELLREHEQEQEEDAPLPETVPDMIEQTGVGVMEQHTDQMETE